MSPARVLILGVDAVDPQLLGRWMADGTLPHLARAAARGSSGEVRSVAGFFVGSTWPSFQSGLSPAGHGVHYLAAIQPGSYALANPYHTNGVHGEPFWATLSRAGHRVAVLDVPLSQLDPTLNGVQLVEWGGHDSIFGFQAHPPELEAAVLQRFGAHPQGPICDGHRQNAADWEAFTERLIQGAKRRAELTRHFLAEEDWDCLIQVFTEAHCAGHQAWHLHDPTHP
ncbi:MAG: alkaline phosphatase family protein, partial [Gemmatimonadota bacterium]|nr:alkaline phosphatase family protein [Gemmatimonadota bacterium]